VTTRLSSGRSTWQKRIDVCNKDCRSRLPSAILQLMLSLTRVGCYRDLDSFLKAKL
jgi:hypothetical protein